MNQSPQQEQRQQDEEGNDELKEDNRGTIDHNDDNTNRANNIMASTTTAATNISTTTTASTTTRSLQLSLIVQSTDILQTIQRRRRQQPSGPPFVTTTLTVPHDDNDDKNHHDRMESHNYPQGCCFSPDGSCILTATVSDSQFRLYNTVSSHDDNNKEWKSALSIPAGESIRSYSWYPFMSSHDPTTCCFVGVSRNQPIHLYDAYHGTIRASYCPYNSYDEIESPLLASFTPDGQSIIAAGFRTNRMIYQFDITRPGKMDYYSTTSRIYQFGKTKRSNDGQKGIISALAFQQSSPKNNHNDTASIVANPRMFAVGTYSPSSIYLYDERMIYHDTPVGKIPILLNNTNQQRYGTISCCVVGNRNHKTCPSTTIRSHENKNHNDHHTIDDETNNDDLIDFVSKAKMKWFYNKSIGGVTQLLFSPTNGYHLFSASRRSNTILLWDIRMLSDSHNALSSIVTGYNSYPMANDTNQRIEFDIDEYGRTLYVGGVDSMIRIYDIMSGHCIEQIQHDCLNHQVVNGISYHHHDHSRSHQGKDNDDTHENAHDVDDDDEKEQTKRTSSIYLAATTGSRIFPPDHVYDDDDDDDHGDSDSSNGDHSSSTLNHNSATGSCRHHNHDSATTTCHRPSRKRRYSEQNVTTHTANAGGGGRLCLFSIHEKNSLPLSS